MWGNFSYKFCRVDVLPISVMEGVALTETSRVPSNYQDEQILRVTKVAVNVAHYHRVHHLKFRFCKFFGLSNFIAGNIKHYNIYVMKNLPISWF